MKDKSPAFQFYAAEYLADEVVQLMTLEEEGACWRLIAYCWREGSIPADPKLLSRLCKNAPLDVVTAAIEGFVPHPTEAGRLVHPRLERERRKQQENRERRANAGKKGANARWQSDATVTGEEALPQDENSNAIAMPSDADDIAIDLPMAKNASSSSSSSSTAVNNKGSHTARVSEQPGGEVHRNLDTPSNPQITPPTLEQVKSAGTTVGAAPECAEAFFHEMEACGWIDSRQRPIRNWQAALRKYAISWRANDFQRGQQTGRSRQEAPPAKVMERPKQTQQSSALFPDGLPPGVKKGW